MTNLNMQPLKVTFTLSHPVVFDNEYSIHLDALLAWARVQDAIDAGSSNPWPEGDDLPLAKAGQGADWVWQASRLFFTPETPRELINMQRKSDPEMFYKDFDEGLWTIRNKAGEVVKGKTPPKINTQSGQYRAYQYYVSAQWMSKVEAWCIGDLDKVKALLDRITHIGKMGRSGFGTVASCTVEIAPAASVNWALRALPMDVKPCTGVEYAPVMSPPRAPYWDKQRRVQMMEPVV